MLKSKKKILGLTLSVLSMGTMFALISSPMASAASNNINNTMEVQNTLRKSVQYLYQMPKLADSEGNKLSTSQGLSDIKANRKAIMSQYYTGHALSQKQNDIDVAIDKEKDGNIKALDGGISSISFNQVTVNGNSASVIAVADVWSKFVLKDPKKATSNTFEPHNKIVINATIVTANI
jgi:hypothetical protein